MANLRVVAVCYARPDKGTVVPLVVSLAASAEWSTPQSTARDAAMAALGFGFTASNPNEPATWLEMDHIAHIIVGWE